jgi:NAD(P)-dependent dehydrogenase (short-subunit alcohol dehydrogenase family)
MQADQERVAVVTGGARGIGAAIARELAANGMAVAIGDYLEAEARETAAAIVASGGRAMAMGCDVRRLDDIRALFAAATEQLGLPSVLVNNAGVYPNHASLEMTEQQWDDVLDINLKGTFFCAQTLARGLVEAGRPGCIVNLASTAAYSARPGAAHYGSSKAAVVALTRALAQEFGPHRIRTNCVAPGLVEAKEGLVTEAYKKQFLTMVPSGRIGRVEDIASVVAFLTSPAADYVNGETIVVDGGFLTGRALQRSGE